MKILHFADSHFSSKRLDECSRNFEYMIKHAIDSGCTVAVCAGDLFDKNTMINSAEYRSAVGYISELSQHMPVYVIRGNHDPKHSLDILKHINGKYDIYVYEEPEDGVIEDRDGNKIHALFLPYINPAIFVSNPQKITDVFDGASEYYRFVIKEFVDKGYDNSVVVAHISVMGAELGNSEKIVSGEVMLEPSDFDGIDMVLLGHIHNHHQSILDGTNIQYSGSHYRMRFGEIGIPGFVVWNIDKNGIKYEFIETPAKRMEQVYIDSESVREFINTGKVDLEIEDGIDYKVVVEVEEGLIGMFDKDAILNKFSDGDDVSLSIKTVVSDRSDSFDMVEINKLSDKFKHWCDVNNVECKKTLLEKVDSIESELGSVL